VGTLTEGKKTLLKHIDDSDEFENEAQKAKVKEVVGKLWEVFEGTLKSGQVDLGATVLGAGPFTVSLALGVADGAAADKALRDVIKLAEDEDVLGKVEYAAHKAGDVTFHAITPKLGDKSEDVGKVLGSDPKIIVASSPKAIYFALGTDAIKGLEGLIEKSKAATARLPAQGQMVLALAPIVKYAASQDPLNPILAKVAESVTPGSDRVRAVGRVVPNGQATRIEVEEGVIKLIAASLMMVREARAPAADFGATEEAIPLRAKPR
jgi:hypothetical protein